MPTPPILAHGALGIFDELIFLGIAAIFLIMMGISWFISRRQLEKDQSLAQSTEASLFEPLTSPGAPTESQPSNADNQPSADRFRLE